MSMIRTIEVSDQWAPLSTTRALFDAELIAHADNAAPIMLRFDGQPVAGAEWPAGIQANIGAVDLQRVEVKGEPGDALTIVGRIREIGGAK